LVFASYVSTESGGSRGRPRTKIDHDFLRQVFAPGSTISKAEFARALKVDRATLQRNLDDAGIDTSFTDLSSEELDDIIAEYLMNKPDHGYQYVHGHLRSLGLKVGQVDVQASLRRVKPLGALLNSRQAVQRRSYLLTRPNAVWHLDGHHKLIRYGIVIHGFIDGYCRTILAMEAGVSNKARKVFRLFKRAIRRYGLPSRARGDRGGENILVAIYMIATRGINRGSFLWGS
jgi:hypothetical protein